MERVSLEQRRPYLRGACSFKKSKEPAIMNQFQLAQRPD